MTVDSGAAHGRSAAGGRYNKWQRWGGGALVIIIAILIAASLALFISTNVNKPADQDHYVDSGKLQAVFLTNDRVYFGNISSINDQYIVLHNIYYLQSNSTDSKSTNNQISLVKLGCELHKPYDQMIIDQSQVSFWENLQSDGQVAKAVAQYQKSNPDGQQCSNTPSNSTSSSEVQGGSNPNNSSPSSSDSSNSSSSKPSDTSKNNTSTTGATGGQTDTNKKQ